MKAGIHPEIKDAKVICACGATFNTKSIKEELHVETCNIEKFNKKYNLNKEAA